MTREEAIDRLRKISEKTPIRTNGDDLVAITMAIQALSQEPCDDAVSREAVDKYIVELLSGYLYDEERERLEKLCAYLWELPSVTQKSETEIWNGIHGQITAPKGTFKKIWEDAESEDKE